MPITREQARAEALVSAPAGVIVFETVEIWHPTFIVNGGAAPLRIVNAPENLTARLESTAPRNPSELVAFLASAFRIMTPAITESSIGNGTIEASNISHQLSSMLESIDTVFEPVQLIFREYLSNDLSAPSKIDLNYTIDGISISENTVSASLSIENLAARRVPNRVYDAIEFSALEP